MKWLLMSLVLLTSCANFTSQQLRTETAPVHTFTVAQPYQAVYRTIMEQARTCYAGGVFVPVQIEGDLYPDTASGQIGFNLYRLGSMAAFLAVEVAALALAQTEVRIYAYWRAQASRAPIIEAWVTRGATDC